MHLFLRLAGALASRRLTTALLIALAAAMAVITVLEAVAGGKEVPYHLYLSWWFTGLMALAWINLACALARRSWWRRRALPGLLTHVGMLLILLGGLATWKLGIRGTLPIAEGETQATFLADVPVLRVTPAEPNEAAATDEFFALTREGAFTIAAGAGGAVLPGGFVRALNPFGARRARTTNGLPLEIHAHLESSRVSHAIEPAPGGPPAITIRCAGTAERILVLRQGAIKEVGETGVSALAYEHVAPGESPGAIVDRVLGESIEIAAPGADAVVIPVALPADAGRELAHGPYRVQILQYHPNFKLGKNPAPDEPPLNPAVKLHVTGPAGERDLYAFAYHAFHGNRLDDGAEIRYRRPRPGTVLVLSHPDGRVEACLDRSTPPRPLAPAAPLVLGACTLTLLDFLPSSREVERFTADPEKTGPPAFLVSFGPSAEPVWLAYEHGVAHTPDGKAAAVLTREFPLGFALTLDDAVARFWPASSIPRAYFSLVRVRGIDGSVGEPARIETNAPLLRNGYRLFQSGMDPNAPYRWSSFAVAYDPGVPLAAAGFYVLPVGLLWLACVRFVARRPRRARGAAEAVQ